jgi:NAD(P)-dependent dehydrogenase (short-subunit alcohol dehydrogenase family)
VPDLPAAFDLTGRVAVVTGGAGLLGAEHARALLETGAAVALLDVDAGRLEQRESELADLGAVAGFVTDVTSGDAVERTAEAVVSRLGPVDILVNNAANDPKVGEGGGAPLSRLESFPDEQWAADIAVGLTGAFICSRSFGSRMADAGGGVILNIASDLAVIAPDQRLYREPGRADDEQPVKPVTYSVVKTGLLGLTRYLATYWADRGIRVNSLSPGGVRVDQPDDFVERLSAHVPLGRMAEADEYRGAVQFLCSDASSYMTGHNLVADGGRSVW